MIVVADSSPLHYLILLEQTALLHRLYGHVLVPESVAVELRAARAPTPVQAWMSRPPSWIEIVHVSAEEIASVAEELDPGERAAIALAEKIRADLILIDETDGRTDENFNNDIVRGLIRRNPAVDIVRLQDVGLSGAADATVLAWAASESRVLVTHDVSTLTKHAYQRVEAGAPMPGVFEVGTSLALGHAIDDLLLLVECSLDGEWEGPISGV